MPIRPTVLDDLVRAADVLIENFLPDTLAKLRLTPERLKQLNSRLVIASISALRPRSLEPRCPATT